MKRLICLILLAAMLLIMCACFPGKEDAAGSEQKETLTEEKNAKETAGSGPNDTDVVNNATPSATSSQAPSSSTTPPTSSTSTTSTTTTAPTSSTTSPTTTTKAPTTTTKAPTTTTKAPTTTTKGVSPIISDPTGGGTATEFGKTDIFK